MSDEVRPQSRLIGVLAAALTAFVLGLAIFGIWGGSIQSATAGIAKVFSRIGRTAAAAEAGPKVSPFDPACFGSVSLRCVNARSAMPLPPAEMIDRRMESVASFAPTSRFRNSAQMVGRLDVLFSNDSGEQMLSACTGILLNASTILTAAHCVLPPARWTLKQGSPAAGFVASYLSTLSHGEWTTAKPCDDFIDPEKDVALIALSGACSPAAIASLAVSLEPPAEGEDIYILHHPLGQPLHVTRANCRITQVFRTGDLLRFWHSCPTLAGSSGAPIFRERDGALIGVHFAGNREPDLQTQNRGGGIPLAEAATALRLTFNNSESKGSSGND